MAIKIAISNKKGGIGKTTTSIEVSSALARMYKSKKILLVDLDPQGHASVGLSCDTDGKSPLSSLLKNNGARAEECIKQSYIDNLYVLASDYTLESTMQLLEASDRGAVFKLSSKLADIENSYDYIIMDCPPAVNTLTTSAFLFADHIIMPIKLGRFEEVGTLDFIADINQINDSLNKNKNHKVELLGVLVTFYNPRANISRKKLSELSDSFGDLIFEAKIPSNVKLIESADEGMSIHDYDASSKGAEAYMSLAKEIAKRVKKESLSKSEKELVNV